MRTWTSAHRAGVYFKMAGTAVAVVACAAAANAQTVVTLDQPKSEVVYATLRGGDYANKNLSKQLETRNGNSLSFERHALLKFDTQHRINSNADVTSAVLTLTVKDASEDPTRRVGAYQVTHSWDETETTWKLRRRGQEWDTPGGDLGTRLAIKTVGREGSRVSFDVTPLVQQAVAGKLGSSRYTRIALVDLDAPTSAGWRAYHTPDDPNVALRPTLKVTLGGKTADNPQPSPKPTPPRPEPTTPSTAGTTLRVLGYNVHHGGHGTDGKYDPRRVVNWIVKMRPDIISLVEMEKGTGWVNGADGVALYKSLLQQKTGHKWYSLNIQDYGNWNSNGIRNAILSRYPFTATDRYEFSVGKDRTVGMVTINVNGRAVNFFSTHFDPDSRGNRTIQGKELRRYLDNFSRNQLVLGDFNDQPGSAAIRAITGDYYDAWVEAVRHGTDKSAHDNPNGYTRRSRIDYVFYPRAKSNLRLVSAEVVDTRDSRGYMPSDHRPLLAVFKVQ